MAVDENSLKLKTSNKKSLAEVQRQTMCQLDAIDSSIATLKLQKQQIIEQFEKFKKENKK